MPLPTKEWIVEAPHSIIDDDVDNELEDYLNLDPHPKHELYQVLVVPRERSGTYVLIWKKK